MRILFVSSSSGWMGGGEHYLELLGRELAGRGHRVGLWCSDDRDMDPLCDGFREFGTVLRAPYTNTFKRVGRSLDAVLPLPGLSSIRDQWGAFQPDLVHVNKQCLEDGLPLLKAVESLGVPHLATIHITQPAAFLGSAFSELRDQIARRGLRRYSGKLICVSAERERELGGFLRQPHHTLAIPNGVAIPSLEDRDQLRLALRQSLGIPDGGLLAVALGRLDPQKRPFRFLQWMQILRNQFSGIRGVWVGDGRLRPEFEDAIEAHGMRDWVSCSGWEPEPHSWLAGADLFLHPSHFEGLPFSLLEAMAWGLPVGLSPEIARDLKFGPEQGCQIIHHPETDLSAMLNPESREDLGNKARNTVVESYSVEKMVAHYERIYHETLEAAVPPLRKQTSTASQPRPARRVAVCFHRLGPYHKARLEAAQKAEGIEVIAVEWSSVDRTYAWERLDDFPFERITCFDEEDPETMKPADIVGRLETALAGAGLDAIVINGWGFHTSLAALAWARRNQIPAVVMSESTPWDEARQPLREWVKSCLLSGFSTALAGGSSNRDYLVELGMPATRIEFGYDVVDNAHFRDGAAATRQDAEQSRLRLGLPEGPYFLASARFIPKKNHQMLLEAYRDYREALTRDSRNRETGAAPWNLIILGDGPLRGEMESQIRALDLERCVILPGFKQYDELPSYYALAEAFLHPSTTEQWGLVVNEAMAVGLPVVVSERCGCAADLVQPERNGYRLHPGSMASWSDAMVRLHQMTPEARRAMGEQSRERIQYWGPERFGSGLARSVARAIELGPSGPRNGFPALLLALIHTRPFTPSSDR